MDFIGKILVTNDSYALPIRRMFTNGVSRSARAKFNIALIWKIYKFFIFHRITNNSLFWTLDNFWNEILNSFIIWQKPLFVDGSIFIIAPQLGYANAKSTTKKKHDFIFSYMYSFNSTFELIMWAKSVVYIALICFDVIRIFLLLSDNENWTDPFQE